MTHPRRERAETPPPERRADTKEDAPDPVEQASEESFPASDPPSWGPLHPGKPAQHPDAPRR